MSTTTASAPRELSTSAAVGLVAEREIVAKVRSKSFVISTIITVVLIVGAIVALHLFGGGAATKVAVVGDGPPAISQSEGFDVTSVTTREEATTLVENGDVEAGVLASADAPTGVVVIAETSPPQDLMSALAIQPQVELLDPEDAGEGPVRYLLSIGFGVLFLLAAMTYGNAIIMSVIEEKATRVVEILLSTVSARVLLAGKVLGNTAIAMGQIVLILAAVTAALAATGQGDLLRGLGAPLVWFAVFFLVGFIVLAAMYAAAGSLVSRQEDAGPVMQPMIYLIMLPYFLVVFFNDNETVMAVMSYVPIASTVAMPVRLYFGEALWWEPIVSLLIALVVAAIVVILGAKVYERSLLKMGARVKLSEALRG